MTLKERLGKLEYASAGSIDAPELGAGEKVHIARLSFGERADLTKIAQDKETTGEGRMRKLLAILAWEEGGAPACDNADDPAIDEIPAPLADRIVEAGMDFNSGAKKDAKKPSPPAAN